MNSRLTVKHLVVGQIRNEFIVNLSGVPFNGVLGGSLLYAASTLKYWADHVGLMGVIGNDFTHELTGKLSKLRFDTRGLITLQKPLDLRDFYAYPSSDDCVRDNPVSVFASKGLAIPRELLGYQPAVYESQKADLDEGYIRLLENIPSEYLDASAAHLCPLELDTQILISTRLMRRGVRTVTLRTHPSYMNPPFREKIFVLCKDLSALITTERELQCLFIDWTIGIWEMMETLGSRGCKYIVMKSNRKGFYFLDTTSSTRYLVPEYPSIISNPTGSLDSFCGGFLAGYQNSFDPLDAMITGCVSSSITEEGTGPFSILDSLPGLALERKIMIRDMVTTA